MRILYYYIDAENFTGSWPRRHYIDELHRAGHTIEVFDPSIYPSVDEANERLANLIKEKGVYYDLFLNLYGHDWLYVETVKLIKAKGIPTLLICPDNLHTPFVHRKVAPLFDIVWLTSFETEPLFRRWGCNTIFLPYAANPHIFKPRYGVEIAAVGFVGTPYGTRILKINELLASDIPCRIYSDQLYGQSNSPIVTAKSIIRPKRFATSGDWYQITYSIGRRILWSKMLKKRIAEPQLIASDCLEVAPSVTFDEMNQLYSNFALSLGITEVWDTYLLHKPVHKIHLRTFEIPMCGGLQFAPYIDELAGYFDEGREIVFYHSKEEYVDKARFYLRESNANLRRQIKRAARLRAETEHTWNSRFKSVFAMLSLR